MKAALHDAIKEQGSSPKRFKHEGGTLCVQWADLGQTGKTTDNGDGRSSHPSAERAAIPAVNHS